MGSFEFGFLGIWDLRNLGPWEFGTLEIWDHGNLGSWEFGVFGIWDLVNLKILNLGDLESWEYQWRYYGTIRGPKYEIGIIEGNIMIIVRFKKYITTKAPYGI